MGCDTSSKKLTGGYKLLRFDEGGLYYLVAPGKGFDGVGYLEGVIRQIAWDQNFILADVDKCYGGDVDGWYAVNVQSGKILGPLSDDDLKGKYAALRARARSGDDAFK